jgi:uncharacterized protein (DUF2147 family)
MAAARLRRGPLRLLLLGTTGGFFEVSLILRGAVLATAAVLLATPSLAADPKGNWLVQNKKAVIQVISCGSAYCGWTLNTVNKGGKMRVERVNILVNMAPASDNVWKGKAHDPLDNASYDAEMSTQGDNILLVKGCGMGFCKQEIWTRTSSIPKAAPPRVSGKGG